MYGSIPTFGPYKVSIPVRFLIVDVGECDKMGTVIDLERGVSWGFSPSEPGVTGVTILQYRQVLENVF